MQKELNHFAKRHVLLQPRDSYAPFLLRIILRNHGSTRMPNRLVGANDKWEREAADVQQRIDQHAD